MATTSKDWLTAAERAAEHLREYAGQFGSHPLSVKFQAEADRDARAVLLLPRAVEALEPFAAAGECFLSDYDARLPGSVCLWRRTSNNPEHEVSVTVGHVRAAARVLADIAAIAGEAK